MSVKKKIAQRRQRRTLRTRKLFRKNLLLPRVSVFRSAKHIYGQLIDDTLSKTIASASTISLKDLPKGDKKKIARHVGVNLAKQALKHGASQAAFDRGSFLYHGRVKALVDGLREGGLKI